MPVVLGMNGFGARNTDRDEIIQVSGVLGYETTELPPDSPSTTSIGDRGQSFRMPWWDHVNVTQFEPSTNELWYHFRYWSNTSASLSTARYGVSRDATPVLSVGFETGTNKIVIRVADTIRATTASTTISTSTWERFHVHMTGATAGSFIHVYMDGNLVTPVLSYTLIGADATALSSAGKPNSFRVVIGGSGTTYVDDFVAWDPADPDFLGIVYFAECGIQEQVFTGNGAEADWSGAYTAIDERPCSDADKITASVVAQSSSFTKAAIGQDNVFAVNVKARVTKTGSEAGDNLTLSIKQGANQESVTIIAPGDGDISYLFNAAPDGTPWSPVSYDATRIVFTSAT
jgi:hypothetical protein